MRAYIFSIGESTAELAEWAVKRLGFNTTVVYNPDTSFWTKLRWLYSHETDDFLRIDADTIVNKNLLKLEPQDNCWWHQCYVWDWYSQDIGVAGINWVKKEAISYLRQHIDKFENAERPESQMFRLDEFHHPRRCEVYNLLCGLHGYGQRDIERIKATKERRKQEHYDWPLIDAIGYRV